MSDNEGWDALMERAADIREAERDHDSVALLAMIAGTTSYIAYKLDQIADKLTTPRPGEAAPAPTPTED